MTFPRYRPRTDFISSWSFLRWPDLTSLSALQPIRQFLDETLTLTPFRTSWDPSYSWNHNWGLCHDSGLDQWDRQHSCLRRLFPPLIFWYQSSNIFIKSNSLLILSVVLPSWLVVDLRPVSNFLLKDPKGLPHIYMFLMRFQRPDSLTFTPKP